MKTLRVASRAMRLQNIPAACAFAIALLAMRPAFAADPAPPSNPDASPAKAAPADLDKPLPLGDPNPLPPPTPSLLPDEIPPRAKRPAKMDPPAATKPAAKLKQESTAAELDLRVRYRKVRNIAETSDRVRAAWEETRYPKNDQQKRDALRRYYDLLFAKMLSMDRGIAPLVEERRKAETATLTQTRIAPTVRTE